MAFIEFQQGDTHYGFAESSQSECEPGLFDPSLHSGITSSHVIDTHGRGKVIVFKHKGNRFALRQYHRGGFMRHLSNDRYLWRGLRHARPWQEFHLLEHMQTLQLPCPVPYAFKVHKAGLTSGGSLITQLIPDTQTLAEHLTQHELPDSLWFAIGQVIRRFHEASIFHADLNAHNILIDSSARVFLLDFDKGARRPHARTWKFANLKRLQRSIMKCWTQADTFYFSPASWDDLRDGYLGVSSKPTSASR